MGHWRFRWGCPQAWIDPRRGAAQSDRGRWPVGRIAHVFEQFASLAHRRPPRHLRGRRRSTPGPDWRTPPARGDSRRWLAMLDTAYTAAGSAIREQWHLDNWGAVCAHIGGLPTADLQWRRLPPSCSSRWPCASASPRWPHLFAGRAHRLPDGPPHRHPRQPGHRPHCDHRPGRPSRPPRCPGTGPVSLYKAQQVIDGRDLGVGSQRRCTAPRPAPGGAAVQIHIDDATGMAEVFATVLATDGACRRRPIQRHRPPPCAPPIRAPTSNCAPMRSGRWAAARTA